MCRIATGMVPWHAAMAATYVHATAPLRRLADRYVIEAALAIANGAAGARRGAEAFARLPEVMARADARGGQIERAVIDLAEAVMLEGRIGETFEAVVTDVDERGARIQLRDLPDRRPGRRPPGRSRRRDRASSWSPPSRRPGGSPSERDRLTGAPFAPNLRRLVRSSTMRLAILAAALLSTAAVAAAQTPVQVDMQPTDHWHAKAREIYARAIAFQTVQGRNQSPQLADYLQEQFRAGGLTDVTIHPHDEHRRLDPALAGGAAVRAQGDPA